MAYRPLMDMTWFVGCIQFKCTIHAHTNMYVYTGCQFDYQLHKVTVSLHEVFLLQRACNCSQAISTFGLFIYNSVEIETVARTG